MYFATPSFSLLIIIFARNCMKLGFYLLLRKCCLRRSQGNESKSQFLQEESRRAASVPVTVKQCACLQKWRESCYFENVLHRNWKRFNLFYYKDITMNMTCATLWTDVTGGLIFNTLEGKLQKKKPLPLTLTTHSFEHFLWLSKNYFFGPLKYSDHFFADWKKK